MIDAQLRKAWRFYIEHAGWVVGRRAQGALDLARAERTLQESDDWRVRWEPEYDDCGCYCDPNNEEYPLCAYHDGEEHTFEVALLERRCCKCGSWEVAQALGGIIDADVNNYRRVIEAELMSEEV